MLEVILPVIQELGTHEGHIYQDEVETMLALLAAAPWTETGTMEAKVRTAERLVHYSWDVVYVRKGLSAPLRMAMCKYVLIPLLEFSAANLCQEFYEQKILQIMDAAEKRNDGMQEEQDGEQRCTSVASQFGFKD